ncbi:MAG: flavodoxin family protein [Rickettsiales bacterium]
MENIKLIYIAYASMNKDGQTAKVANLIHNTINNSAFSKNNKIKAKLIDLTENYNIDEFDNANMIVFGSPTYMGSASSHMKKFQEASSGKWSEQKWKDKLAAGFTNGSSQAGDQLNTIFQLFIFACQHSMQWISTGVKTRSIINEKGEKICINKAGSYSGLTTQVCKQTKDIHQDDEATVIEFALRLAEIVSK